ncbi:hypothetical protein ACFLYQ_02425 [Chloroflexota bacterium]
MGLTLDEPKENEQPVQVNGIDILIENFARPFVDESTIDYIKHDYGEEFVINGPESDKCC